MRSTPPILVLALLAGLVLAGCAGQPTPATQAPSPSTHASTPSYAAMGFNGTHWPRLDGASITILDHGAFDYAFPAAKEAFENLTGATVEHVGADDAGSMLNRAAGEKGDPTFDVLYGVDNAYYARAVEQGLFAPYKPVLADRISPEHVFFGNGTWYATPVDHGYIAVNVDATEANVTIATLEDLRDHAGLFVTQDPRTSSPGLGFLLATIAAYPDGSEYDWRDYWTDLFENNVTVTSGWTEAYANRFTRGYGSADGQADKPVVTSYTTSPAYEMYYGTFGENATDYAQVLLAESSVFHQIETMGIANGTKNRAAAEAWIEFTLTDAFQELLAPNLAIYPVVPTVGVDTVYGGNDPAPAGLGDAVAKLSQEEIGENLQAWIGDWVDLCEARNCA